MNFRNLASIFSLASGLLNIAVGQTIFSKQDSTSNWFTSVCEERGTGNYLISNLNYTNTPQNQTVFKPSILKINAHGKLLDSILLIGNYSASGPLLPVDSNYFLVTTELNNHSFGNFSYKAVVLKLDLLFNVQKKIILDSVYNNFLFAQKAILMNRKIYLGYTLSNPDSLRLFKLSLNLERLDSSVFKPGYLMDIETCQNGLVISGRGFLLNNNILNVQVEKLDTNFNTISRFNLDSLTTINPGCQQSPGIMFNVANLVSLNNSKYFVTGSYPVVSNANCDMNIKTVSAVVHSNSVVVKTHIIGEDAADNMYFLPVNSTSDRYGFIYSVAMAGYNFQNPAPPQKNNTKILVHKIDSLGNLLWSQVYGGDRYYAPLGIHATADGGAVVCGMRYDSLTSQTPNSCEGFIMKLSKNGNLELVGLGENGSEYPTHLKGFPNPSSTNIYFDIPFQNDIKIRIFDVSGRAVLYINDYQNLSAVNIVHLNKGVYFYHIATKFREFSGKFVRD